MPETFCVRTAADRGIELLSAKRAGSLGIDAPHFDKKRVKRVEFEKFTLTFTLSLG